MEWNGNFGMEYGRCQNGMEDFKNGRISSILPYYISLMAFTEKYIHCANSVAIASSDHRICSLQFAAALMLTGLIVVFKTIICLVPSQEQTK